MIGSVQNLEGSSRSQESVMSSQLHDDPFHKPAKHRSGGIPADWVRPKSAPPFALFAVSMHGALGLTVVGAVLQNSASNPSFE